MGGGCGSSPEILIGAIGLTLSCIELPFMKTADEKSFGGDWPRALRSAEFRLCEGLTSTGWCAGMEQVGDNDDGALITLNRPLRGFPKDSCDTDAGDVGDNPMMGSKGSTNGDEYEAFSRRWRRMLVWKRGEIKKIKRGFWKRQRKAIASDACKIVD